MAYVPAESLAIRRVSLDSLHLDSANARSHPAGVKVVAASLNVTRVVEWVSELG